MTLSNSTVSWKKLIHQLEAFEEAWNAGAPPAIEDFLPDPDNSQRLPTLVELIKVDLEYRWTREIPARHLEDYAARFPELIPQQVYPLDLIYEEFHLRRQAGEAPEMIEYAQRFPQQAADVKSLLAFESPDASTSIRKRGGKQQFEAGQRIDDFDLLTLLGEGAFAQVFLARQISMQRMCALKISAATGEEHKTLAQLDHPHIVRVFSQTVLEARGLRLLYMQYHAGGTLKEVIDVIRKLDPEQRNGEQFLRVLDRTLDERGVPIPLDSFNRRELLESDWPQVVCWLGIRLAEALAYAHQKDVLHRDLKPANILLASDGSPKLADFNISFCKQVEGATPVAYFGGSLAYMSPEQLAACDPTRSARPEDLDQRSDIYSVGVLLWELLTGTRPFPDLSWGLQGSQLIGEMIHDRQRGPDVTKLPLDVPPLLRQVLEKCLASDPEQRFFSGTELARQLQLSLDREIAQAIAPPQAGWRKRLRRSPTGTILVLTALPNICMSLLNIIYNYDEIVALNQRDLFKVQVGMLNVLAYGSGFTLIALILAPVRRAFNPGGTTDETTVLQAGRTRAIQAGYWTAGISLVEWLLCGILFPLGLHLVAGEAVLTHYVHFFVSHFINGSLAAAGAFFLISDFALRELLPQLLDLNQPDPETGKRLHRLEVAGQWFLGGTICLPLIAIGLAVGLTRERGAFGVLAVLGLIGVGLAYQYAKTLRHRLNILKRIVS